MKELEGFTMLSYAKQIEKCNTIEKHVKNLKKNMSDCVFAMFHGIGQL